MSALLQRRSSVGEQQTNSERFVAAIKIKKLTARRLLNSPKTDAEQRFGIAQRGETVRRGQDQHVPSSKTDSQSESKPIKTVLSHF